MPKITSLPPATTLEDNDPAPIVDESTGGTKKFTLLQLLVWLQTKIGWVTTPMLKPKIIDSQAPGGFTIQGARFSTTSTSFVAVPGCSMSYTSGATAERLFLHMEVMAISNPGNGEVTLFVNTTGQFPQMYVDPGSPWTRSGQVYIVDVPANTTITLGIRAMTVGGSTIQVVNEQAKWMATIRGFAISNA